MPQGRVAVVCTSELTGVTEEGRGASSLEESGEHLSFCLKNQKGIGHCGGVSSMTEQNKES